jgi:glycosyltransferase involved in cell wall biosynthesis
VALVSRSPCVSIGIPFRDPGPSFVGAVQSVFAQSLSDWELILINDGSRDGSVDLAARITDPRVRVLDDGTAKGLVARLNQLIDVSRGDYVARMDADDMMHPRRLETQINYLMHRPEVHLVDTGAVIMDVTGRPVGTRGLDSDQPPDAAESLKWGAVFHASVVARRNWYADHRYDPSYPRAEDRELFLRAFRSTTIGHIPEPLYFYFTIGNIRRQAYLQSYRSERKVLLKYGPTLIGRLATAQLYGRSLAKSLTLSSLLALGCERVVLKNSFTPVGKADEDMIAEAIRQIRNQTVPGW